MKPYGGLGVIIGYRILDSKHLPEFPTMWYDF